MSKHAPQTPPQIDCVEVGALVGAGVVVCVAIALTVEAIVPTVTGFGFRTADWRDPAILAAALLHGLVTVGHTYLVHGARLRKARDQRSTPGVYLTPAAKTAFAAMWFSSLVIVMHAALGFWSPDLCLGVAIFEVFFAPTLAWAMEQRPFVLFDGLEGLRRGATARSR